MSKILFFVLIVLCLGFVVPAAHAQNTVPIHSIDSEWLNEWLVLGPFFPDNLEKDFLADVGGEANIHPQEGDTVTTAEGKILTWKRYTAKENLVDLVDAVGNEENATAYAFCLLQSEEARSVKIGLGSDDGVAVFFNGQTVHRHHVTRGVTLDEDVFEVQMKADLNRCLVKVYSGGGPWGVAMRVLFPTASLIAQLTDENNDVRDSAVRALGHIGAPAVQPLIAAWKSDNMLLNVAEALAQIGKPAIPALTEALNDPKEHLRPLAAGALGRIDDARRDEMIGLLIEALERPDAIVRNHAAWALGQMGEPAKAAVPALISALSDENKDVRNNAAWALGEMGGPAKAAVPALIDALTDEYYWVRRHAAATLAKIGEPAKAAVPALTNALTDEDTEVRRNAAWALHEIGKSAAAAVTALTNALADEDDMVRRNTAQALGQMGELAQPAVPALIQTLSDENKDARQAAARTLGQIGKPAEAAVPALINALTDEDKTIRPAVALALGRIGEPAQAAVPALISALSDEHDSVRSNAARALNRIGIPEPMNTVYERKDKAHAMLFAGVLLAFGLLHLLLFLFYPKSAGNLYYAILVGTIAAFSFMQGISGTSTALERLKLILSFAFFVILLRFLYSLFYPRLPRKFFLFLAGWIVVSAWYAFMPFFLKQIFIVLLPLLLFSIGSLTEMFRVLIGAIRKKKDGAWIIGTGFTVFMLAYIAAIVAQRVSIFVFAALGLLISMSIHLARNFAKTNKALEAKNQQISVLNERLKDENLRMSAELEITKRIQRMILPGTEELRSIADLDIAGYMAPADDVGGDYYDVLQREGMVAISIGDVTGHGLESGLVMLMTQTAVQALLHSGETDPVHFLDTLNRTIYNNVQRMASDKNLTLCLLDYQSGELKLSGQHEEMIVVRRDGKIELVDTIDLGFPIGLDDEIADFIDQTTVQLAQGDGAVLYTDGITEAENESQEQYGLERLCGVVSSNWSQSAEEIKEAVVADVLSFIGEGEIYDDITLVVLKQK